MRTTLVLVLGTAIALSTRPLAQRSTSSSQPSIKGVWRAVEQTINDRTIKDANLGVGFHVYTDGYFAVIRESGTPPRPPAPVENATAEKLMAAYGPFVAQFGTYQVSGDVISEITLARPRTAGSVARGPISTTAETSWPARRRAVTTAKSQLSSARKRTG